MGGGTLLKLSPVTENLNYKPPKYFHCVDYGNNFVLECDFV